MNKTTKNLQKSMQNNWYEEQNTFLCKIVSLYIINNLSVILEIIFCKFSISLKIMSRNTFPDPQPDSASYVNYHFGGLGT